MEIDSTYPLTIEYVNGKLAIVKDNLTEFYRGQEARQIGGQGGPQVVHLSQEFSLYDPSIRRNDWTAGRTQFILELPPHSLLGPIRIPFEAYFQSAGHQHQGGTINRFFPELGYPFDERDMDPVQRLRKLVLLENDLGEKLTERKWSFVAIYTDHDALHNYGLSTKFKEPKGKGDHAYNFHPSLKELFKRIYFQCLNAEANPRDYDYGRLCWRHFYPLNTPQPISLTNDFLRGILGEQGVDRLNYLAFNYYYLIVPREDEVMKTITGRFVLREPDEERPQARTSSQIIGLITV